MWFVAVMLGRVYFTLHENTWTTSLGARGCRLLKGITCFVSSFLHSYPNGNYCKCRSTLLCWRWVWCIYGREDTLMVCKGSGVCHAHEVWDEHHMWYVLAIVIVYPKVVVVVHLIMPHLKVTVQSISVVVATHLRSCSLLYSHDIDGIVVLNGRSHPLLSIRSC